MIWTGSASPDSSRLPVVSGKDFREVTTAKIEAPISTTARSPAMTVRKRRMALFCTLMRRAGSGVAPGVADFADELLEHVLKHDHTDNISRIIGDPRHV